MRKKGEILDEDSFSRLFENNLKQEKSNIKLRDNVGRHNKIWTVIVEFFGRMKILLT